MEVVVEGEWDHNDLLSDGNHRLEAAAFTIPFPEMTILAVQVNNYSQLPPCGHLAITDTPLLQTAAKSPAKLSYRRLTEINSRYYGLSLLRTPNRGPEGVRYNRS